VVERGAQRKGGEDGYTSTGRRDIANDTIAGVANKMILLRGGRGWESRSAVVSVAGSRIKRGFEGGVNALGQSSCWWTERDGLRVLCLESKGGNERERWRTGGLED